MLVALCPARLCSVLPALLVAVASPSECGAAEVAPAVADLLVVEQGIDLWDREAILERLARHPDISGEFTCLIDHTLRIEHRVVATRRGVRCLVRHRS
jgi:hypothetical protein